MTCVLETGCDLRIWKPTMRILLLLITLLASDSLFAEIQRYGSWLTNTDSNDFVYAATLNENEHLFGQYCFPAEGACVWLLGFRTGCQQGDSYPALANSDSGAAHIEIICGGRLENGLYRYALADFDTIDDLVKKGGRLGFAVPFKEDQFRLIRFDLTGARAAIDAIRRNGGRQIKPMSRGTRDQRL